MKRLIVFITLIFIIQSAIATQQEYCAGFKAGWHQKAGQYSMPPYCPMAPYGKDSYQQGVIDGYSAAKRRGY